MDFFLKITMSGDIFSGQYLNGFGSSGVGRQQFLDGLLQSSTCREFAEFGKRNL